MELRIGEIARYMRMGSVQPRAELLALVNRLVAEAPLNPRGIWRRIDASRFFLCGTVGTAFDAWHRRQCVLGATEALVAQAVGTAAVENEMDALESEIRATLKPGERLRPRWSPGYGNVPLAMSREILDVLDASRTLGVTLTEGLLLAPSKSVTAVCEIERRA